MWVLRTPHSLALVGIQSNSQKTSPGTDRSDDNRRQGRVGRHVQRPVRSSRPPVAPAGAKRCSGIKYLPVRRPGLLAKTSLYSLFNAETESGRISLEPVHQELKQALVGIVIAVADPHSALTNSDLAANWCPHC